MTFTNPETLTKDYSGCTFNGEITIKSGKFTNSTFTGEITVKNGTFTDCIFDGKVFLYNGSSTGDSSVKGSECYIYDGNWIFNNNEAAINSSKVNIYGGSIKANGVWGAGIGGNSSSNGKNVTIYGGYITATSVYGAGIGGGDGYSGGGQGGTTIIYGGTVVAIVNYYDAARGFGIGSGRANRGSGITKIYGGSIKGTIDGQPITTGDQPVYLGKLEVQNVTDVSVDGKPYYIDRNIDEDDNLYLYMTGDKHTVTVRTSGSNNVTTYNATYASQGVNNDGTNKGYFTFDSGTSSTPTESSSVAFNFSNYDIIYGTDKLTVKLTVTNKVTRTRSAAMNSVQLALIDEENNVLLSDWKDVTTDGEYEFEFDTKKLNAGTYTLTAQYGGSSESNPSSKQEVPLIIAQAEGTKAPEYEDPTLTAIYKNKLSDIQLPTGWTWDVPEAEVGNVGDNTFAAIFTPKDTRNYKVVSKDLTVTVSPLLVSKLDDPKVISSQPVTYGITLSNIEITDKWKWVDGNTIPRVSSWNSYPAYYEIEDDTNYDWSKISGYNKGQHRVIREIELDVKPIYLEAKDFIFTPPENLIYDDQGKEAKVEVKDKSISYSNFFIEYYNTNGELVRTPKEPGTYTVSITFFMSTNYVLKEDPLTDLSWTFTIKELHNITITSSIANGRVTVNKEKATEGETIILKANPASGYELESLSYTQLSDGATISITNKTFIMPESDVTVTATFKKTTVTPPPVGPIDPDPTPVYYTVTLPAIEGVITDPTAGSFDIQAWDSFSFFLTLEEGYREGSAPVVTAGGKVITPRVSDGKYIVPNIHTDIKIEISGIVKDVATGNEPLPSGFSVSTANGLLLITAPYPTRMYLTDTSGRLILTRQLPSGDTRITDLTSGIYILVLEGQKSRKIMLR